MKRPLAADNNIRQQVQNINDKMMDHENDLYDQKMNQNVNNSFTEKRGPPSKWVLMNSKHVRNKSEAKVVALNSAAKPKVNEGNTSKDRNLSEIRSQKEQVNPKNN